MTSYFLWRLRRRQGRVVSSEGSLKCRPAVGIPPQFWALMWLEKWPSWRRHLSWGEAQPNNPALRVVIAQSISMGTGTVSLFPHLAPGTLEMLHRCLLNKWKNHNSEKQSIEKIKIVVTSDGAEITSFLLSFDFGSFNAVFTLFEINY